MITFLSQKEIPVSTDPTEIPTSFFILKFMHYTIGEGLSLIKIDSISRHIEK